jgi:UDP:flavonoid glycosyltransferase YjiC (YdhE family)
VPLATAFAESGHEVAFTTAASLTERVESAGFTLLPAGLELDERPARFAPYRAEHLALPSSSGGRCSSRVALRLLPDDLEPAAVASAVDSLLKDGSHRERARQIAAEIAAMPTPSDLVPVLLDASRSEELADGVVCP